MNVLQQAFDKVSLDRLTAKLISQKAQEHGCSLTDAHYKFASHNVHANPKGILTKLGLYSGGREILLAGPSDTGFTDPAHGAAVSLLQITASLLTTRPNIDRLCVCKILSTLAGEVGNSFLSIQKNQEEALSP